MKCDLGNNLVEGMEVIVSGNQDTGAFNCNIGVVVNDEDYCAGAYGTCILIRFSDWNEGHGEDKNQWYFFENDRAAWTITFHGIATPAPVGPSTYLNGLEDSITFEPRYEWSEDPISPVEASARPRFMTAYLVTDDRVFVPTGDAFMTKEAADAGALEALKGNEVEDQIAVLELRTVHMARLTIMSETA